MIDTRCPDCESFIVELDCADCLAYARHVEAVRIMDERFRKIAQATRTHCPNGHEMTDRNTRIDVRTGAKQSITRACRACHNERGKATRALRKGAETTQPREQQSLDRGRAAPTGRMTPQTLPVEVAT